MPLAPFSKPQMAIAVLLAMWVVCLTSLSQTSLNAAQWQSFAVAGFTTLLGR